MRALYIEGFAVHDGPESCVGVPRGRSEALIGVRAGWVIEPRNAILVWGADALLKAEGNTAGGVRRVVGGPCAVREPGHVRSLHAREPGDLVVAREVLMMPRPGWFAGWQIDTCRAVRGTLRR